MLALGLSGWVRRCTEAAPMPIVMGMVAGVFLRFGLDWWSRCATTSGSPGMMARPSVLSALRSWVGAACRP